MWREVQPVLIFLFLVPSLQSTEVNISDYFMTASLDDKIFTGGNLEDDCNVLTFGDTLRACPIDPPSRLIDGITLDGQPFNSDQFIGWRDDVLLIFEFPVLTSITRVDIYFYNNPSEGIGLPPLQTIARYTDGSFDFDLVGTPIGVSFSDNSHLTQQDDMVTSVSIAIDSFADGPNFGVTFELLRLIFNTTNTNINTTYISEVELFSVTGGGAPVFSPIQFTTPVDQSMVYGSINSTTLPSSVDLVCTVSNNGSFMYTWTGPDGMGIMNNDKTSIYSVDTTHTSILRISQLSITDNGTYSCGVTYDHIRGDFGQVLPEASTTITLHLQGSVSTPGTVLAAIGDESVDLSCIFTGYLPSTYTIIWRNSDGEVLEDSTDGYNITTSLEGPGQANIGGQSISTGVTSTLTINNVVQSDIGTQYTCEMEGTGIIGIIQLDERPVLPTTTSPIGSPTAIGTTTLSAITTSTSSSTSSPSMSPPLGGDNSNAIAAIAGGVAGAAFLIIILVIIIAVVIVVLIVVNRRGSKDITGGYPSIDPVYTDIHKPSPPPLPGRLLNDGYTTINLPDDDDDRFPMKDMRMSSPIQNGSHQQPTKILSRPDFLQANPMYSSRENLGDSNIHVAGSLAFLDKANETDYHFSNSAFNIYAEPSVAPSIPSYHGTPDPMEIYSDENLNPAVFRSACNDDNEDLYQIYRSVYHNPQPLQRSEAPLEVKEKNIRKLKDLGVGQFGEVVLAHTVGLSLKQLRMSESNSDPGVSMVVAVKRLKSEADESMREAFENEIKFMARLNHENVIRLLGVCLSQDAFIMMEYMEEGDLNNYLKAQQFVTVDNYPLPEGTVDVAVLVYMCLQVAAGMRYLADLRYIHRDLATRNVLVGQEFKVKIADFGMSQQLYSSFYYRVKGRAVLPIRWMANECFYGRFSEKTDVWSYGVLMWEAFTLCRKQPYESFTDQELIDDAIKADQRTLLNRPDTCPEEVYHVMLRCWAGNPDARANFEEVHGLLLQIHAYNQDI